ncbi:MAG: 2-oxo acid dehydrogenase subunit E2, partial [Clostridia bacterium]|nr:2-oxo acid dehydrogenase subunit E2 [Clostridia bacterium]
MATPVIMPRQGQSVESCVITTWNKKVGDRVEVGDILFSYETDKSAFDETSAVDGTMLAIFYREGDDVECLKTVCVIGKEGEDVSGFAPEAEKAEAKPAEAVKAEAPAAPTAEVQTATAAAPEQTGERVFVSPRARKLAAESGAILSEATGTGPNGRVIERDVQALIDNGRTFAAAEAGAAETAEKSAEAAPAVTAVPATVTAAAEDEYVDEKLQNIRKVIAKTMHASLSEMAQLTLNSSFDAARVLAYRAMVKENGEKLGLGNITINDIICFAVTRVLNNHRSLNANFLGDTMRFYNHVNLGIGVDTERGLIVPTVMHADEMSLSEFSKAARELIYEARAGTISPDKLQGASFTVSNLGAKGIESFTPVINPPQTAI